jgi:Response regulators consisting of a CheY-like receiver domain and a winged-helix DNA-binding domain
MSDIHILAIDDDSDVLAVIEMIFKAYEPAYELILLNNPQNVIETVNRIDPHVIITDWEMPGMTGLEVIKEIRKNEQFNTIPVIVSTGVMTGSKHLEIALAAGANDFILKPFDRIVMIARTRSMVTLSLTLRNLHSQNSIILENKKRELVSNALQLVQISEMNTMLIEKLKDIEQYTNAKGKQLIHALITEHGNPANNINWKEFEKHFSNVYEDFYRQLAQKHPELTPGEKKLCAMLRLKLSSKEIASLTLQNPQSIDIARYRIRKKLQLSQDVNLVSYLSGF